MISDPKVSDQLVEGVLWDYGRTNIVGYRFASDWRPTRVPVTVGDRTVDGLHLIQMFHYLNGDPEEFLVTYPSDGYWRAKPLPPAGRQETAYGDRKSGVSGKSVSVRVDLGGRRIIKKKNVPQN